MTFVSIADEETVKIVSVKSDKTQGLQNSQAQQKTQDCVINPKEW